MSHVAAPCSIIFTGRAGGGWGDKMKVVRSVSYHDQSALSAEKLGLSEIQISEYVWDVH